MTTPLYNQSEREANQEREILSLRARLAESQKRVAELQRLYDNSQNYIQRLMAKIKRLQATPAEQLFRRPQ
jgi:hypothetical protein